MAVITKVQLENAAVDADDLSQIVNGPDNMTVTTRLGEEVDTVAKVIKDLAETVLTPPDYQGPPGPDTEAAIQKFISMVTISAAVAGVASDQAALINAELADPDVFILWLPDGEININHGIINNGKQLYGRGRDSTIIKAMVDFEDSATNAVAILMQGDSPVVADLTVDVNKRGLGEAGTKRCNGVVADNGCTGYVRQNLRVKNFTGYGIYDAGASDFATPPSGNNYDIITENGQVHYEPQGVVGVTYNFCHARDGDGDIPCLQWFHPLVGCKEVWFNNCTGLGAAGAGADLTPNIANLENIYFNNCRIRVTGSTVAFSTTGGFLDVVGLFVSNSSFISDGGVGVVLNNTEKAFFNQAIVKGIGVGVELNGSDIIFGNCDIYSYSNPAGGSASKGIYAPGTQQARFNGGRIEAVGPVGLMIPYEGGVILDSGAITIPASTGPSIDADGNIETDKGFIFKGAGGIGGKVFKGGWLEYGAPRVYRGALDNQTTPGTTTYKILVDYSEKTEIWTTASPSTTAPALSMTFDNTGINLETGRVVKVAGTQVVGPRGAAVADIAVSATTGTLPTANGTVVIANAATPTVVELLEYCRELEATLEALLARIRTHGLIAP